LVSQELFNDVEGNFMLQNVIQVHEVNSSTENPLRHGWTVLSKLFNGTEFDSPLYYFSLPGFVLGTYGVYMGFNLLQTFESGNFDLGSTALIFLLILTGTCMVFMGILLHLIDSLIKYRRNSLVQKE
jgi:hypothetical protein